MPALRPWVFAIVAALVAAPGSVAASGCGTFYVSRVDESVSPDGPVPPSVQLLPAAVAEPVTGQTRLYAVERQPIITGDDVAEAQSSLHYGTPVVAFRLHPSGAERFAAASAANIGAMFAIVVEGKVVSAPIIRAAIPNGEGIIDGGFTAESASALASVLNGAAIIGQAEASPCHVSALQAGRFES